MKWPILLNYRNHYLFIGRAQLRDPTDEGCTVTEEQVQAVPGTCSNNPELEHLWKEAAACEVPHLEGADTFDPAFYEEYKNQFEDIHYINQIEFDCIGAFTYAYWHNDGGDNDEEICKSFNVLLQKAEGMFEYEDDSLDAEVLKEVIREAWGREDFDFGTC